MKPLKCRCGHAPSVSGTVVECTNRKCGRIVSAASLLVSVKRWNDIMTESKEERK